MRRTVAALLLGGCLASACSADEPRDSGGIAVVAAFYPVAEAAKRVGGDLVRVTNLTPAGVEPHEYELTTRDVDTIYDADLVLYVGSDFQPALTAAVKRRDGEAADVGRGLIVRGRDPHFWLDPLLMAMAVDRVRDALIGVDEANRFTYARNAAEYRLALDVLASEYTTALDDCERDSIVTAHDAFSYVAKRYDFLQYAIAGVTPDAEPDPRRLAELADLIRARRVTTVFYEELVPRDFAETLAKEANVKTGVLNPLEGLTKRQIAAGEDYLSIMRANLVALAAALECRAAV